MGKNNLIKRKVLTIPSALFNVEDDIRVSICDLTEFWNTKRDEINQAYEINFQSKIQNYYFIEICKFLVDLCLYQISGFDSILNPIKNVQSTMLATINLSLVKRVLLAFCK